MPSPSKEKKEPEKGRSVWSLLLEPIIDVKIADKVKIDIAKNAIAIKREEGT